MLAKSLKRMVVLHDQTAAVLPGCRQRANRLFGPRSEARSLPNAFGYWLGVRYNGVPPELWVGKDCLQNSC